MLGLKKYFLFLVCTTHKQVLPSHRARYLYIHMIRYIQIIKDCYYNFQSVVLLIDIENLVTQAIDKLISRLRPCIGNLFRYIQIVSLVIWVTYYKN